jgi:hypothetical protein
MATVIDGAFVLRAQLDCADGRWAAYPCHGQWPGTVLQEGKVAAENMVEFLVSAFTVISFAATRSTLTLTLTQP